MARQAARPRTKRFRAIHFRSTLIHALGQLKHLVRGRSLVEIQCSIWRTVVLLDGTYPSSQMFPSIVFSGTLSQRASRRTLRSVGKESAFRFSKA